MQQILGNRPLDELVPGLIGFTLAGGVLLWSIAWIVFGLLARVWPTAEGEILECRFEASWPSSGRHTGTRYTLRLRYRYSVEGKTYEGKRLHFGAAIAAYNGASLGRVTMHTPGERLPVRYFPLAPGVCTLESRIAWQVWLAFVLSLMVTFNLTMAAFGG